MVGRGGCREVVLGSRNLPSVTGSGLGDRGGGVSGWEPSAACSPEHVMWSSVKVLPGMLC